MNNTQIKEVDIIENEMTRKDLINRIDALDKVKQLVTLPDTELMTTRMVAEWYEVGEEAIKSIVKRNKNELSENGVKVLRGSDLREFKRSVQDEPTIKSYSVLTIFSKRSVLNVGMLLQDSAIAKEVRVNLLDVHDQVSDEQKALHIDKEKELALAIMFAKSEADRMVAFNEYNQYKDRHIEKLEGDIKAQEPKVEVYNQIVDAANLVSMNKVAKSVGVGEQKLFSFLREVGILYKEGTYNIPYQQFINKDYFQVKISTKETRYGTVTQYVTKATGKGEIYVLNKVNKYGGGSVINKLKMSEIGDYVASKKEEFKDKKNT